MSVQGDCQASVRAITSTALDYNGDWSALFDDASIAAGDWNGRLLAYINQTLSASHGDLPAAQQAFAEAAGFNNWGSMSDISGAIPE